MSALNVALRIPLANAHERGVFWLGQRPRHAAQDKAYGILGLKTTRQRTHEVRVQPMLVNGKYLGPPVKAN